MISRQFSSLIRRSGLAMRAGSAGAALLTVLACVACDKVPLTAPSGTTITLAMQGNYVGANGYTDLIVTVREFGGAQVQNGTVVTFDTTLGSVDPREVRTSNGEATA